MTKKEFCERLADVQRRLAEAKRRNDVLLDNENERHSDADRAEEDLHRWNTQKLKTEYYEQNQELMAEQAKLRGAWAEQVDRERSLKNLNL